jgi:hypothetical protein
MVGAEDKLVPMIRRLATGDYNSVRDSPVPRPTEEVVCVIDDEPEASFIFLHADIRTCSRHTLPQRLFLPLYTSRSLPRRKLRCASESLRLFATALCTWHSRRMPSFFAPEPRHRAAWHIPPKSQALNFQLLFYVSPAECFTNCARTTFLWCARLPARPSGALHR